jgi:hypothetical protein
MSIIENLRSFHGANGLQDDIYHEIDDILGAYKPDGYSIEEIETGFEEGGRWSNWKTVIYKVTENGAEAYFSFGQEIPASECQDGMDLSYDFVEVIPKEVTVIQYVVKKEAE